MSNHNGVKIGIGGESLDNFAAQNVKICPSCDRINGAMKGIMSSVIRFLLCLCVSSLFSVPWKDEMLRSQARDLCKRCSACHHAWEGELDSTTRKSQAQDGRRAPDKHCTSALVHRVLTAPTLHVKTSSGSPPDATFSAHAAQLLFWFLLSSCVPTLVRRCGQTMSTITSGKAIDHKDWKLAAMWLRPHDPQSLMF
jgi:hypothetical protein